MTGATNLSTELSVARIQLLKEISPRISRVALLWHEIDPIGAAFLKKLRQTGQSLGIEIEPHKLKSTGQFQTVFEEIAANRDNGILVHPQTLFTDHLADIAGRCLKARVAAVSGVGEFVDAGGLMSYGLNAAQMWQHTAV